MATKPTRLQTKARDDLAEALLLITGAARLDGRGSLDSPRFAEIATRIARVSSAYPLEEIVAGAIERRALELGLSAAAAEMLTLVESDVKPLDMLLLDDDAFRALAATLDEELGEV
jgi:hypothetical protein